MSCAAVHVLYACSEGQFARQGQFWLKHCLSHVESKLVQVKFYLLLSCCSRLILARSDSSRCPPLVSPMALSSRRGEGGRHHISPLGLAYAGAMAEAKGIARLVQKQAGRAKEKVGEETFCFSSWKPPQKKEKKGKFSSNKLWMFLQLMTIMVCFGLNTLPPWQLPRPGLVRVHACATCAHTHNALAYADFRSLGRSQGPWVGSGK